MRRFAPRKLDEEIESLHREGKRVDSNFLLHAVSYGHDLVADDTTLLHLASSLGPLYVEELISIAYEVSQRLESVARRSRRGIEGSANELIRAKSIRMSHTVSVSDVRAPAADISFGSIHTEAARLAAVLTVLQWALTPASNVCWACR